MMTMIDGVGKRTRTFTPAQGSNQCQASVTTSFHCQWY